MLTPGLCSVTLKHLTPQEIINCVADTPLKAIEWWGGNHVPANQIRRATEVGKRTREAGLQISAYGSYYRAGGKSIQRPSFESILEAAAALEAPAIRIWAGERDAEDADESDVQRAVEDTTRIAELAGARGITITFEFHSGTLTNSAINARSFANLVPLTNVHFSWQPPLGRPAIQCSQSLTAVLSRLSSLHAFHWTTGSSRSESQIPAPPNILRHPLAAGAAHWKNYLEIARTTNRLHFVSLEFVRGDSVEQVRIDAQELARLCTTPSPSQTGPPCT